MCRLNSGCQSGTDRPCVLTGDQTRITFIDPGSMQGICMTARSCQRIVDEGAVTKDYEINRTSQLNECELLPSVAKRNTPARIYLSRPASSPRRSNLNGSRGIFSPELLHRISGTLRGIRQFIAMVF